MVNYKIENIKTVERVEDFQDEYVYDIIMEDEKYPYFFANDILVHNSVFVTLDNIVNERYGKNVPDTKTVLEFLLKYSKQIIEPKIDEFLNKLKVAMNMKELTIGMELECIASASIHTAKKRYIMNKVWDEGIFHVDSPKKKIRGIEIVRTSTPQWCRDKLKESVDLIFKTMNNDDIIEFINKSKSEFMNLPIENISFPRGVTFADYKHDTKGLPIAVKGAFEYNKYIKDKKLDNVYHLISDAEKIKFCYVKKPNILGTHVISFPKRLPDELKNILVVDYDLQFNKSFLEPLKTITDSIGWQVEKVSDLSDFFS